MKNENKKRFTGMEQLDVLLRSRRRAILINTFEEGRSIEDMKELLASKQMQTFEWSLASGLIDSFPENESSSSQNKFFDPSNLMNHIMGLNEPAVFILKDFHDVWTNVKAKRAMRDLLEKEEEFYKPLILVSHEKNIPTELEKLITIVEYELPTRLQVIEELEGMEAILEERKLPVPTGREREAIIHSLVGMTISEISNVLKATVVKHDEIVLDEITAEKEQVIKKTGLLEYITNIGDMEKVGGLDILKDWLKDAKYAFDPEARKFNIDPVRGCIATGIPGTGKSLVAQSVAHSWNLPLLKMNMSWIMDSKVGASEKNIDRALRLAEAVAPCVLWLDEIEKALSGVQSSNQSDAGTTSRVFQSILTWLSDRKAPVFVMATANNITSLPPELTRAGRFDEVFFVSLPHQAEREEILKIHLQKRSYTITDGFSFQAEEGTFATSDIAMISEQMEGFTGAEIELVVSESGRRAYAAYCKGLRSTHHLSLDDLIEQLRQVVPMSKRNPELIQELREWAKGAAKCASSEEHKHLHGANRGKAQLFSLEGFD